MIEIGVSNYTMHCMKTNALGLLDSESKVNAVDHSMLIEFCLCMQSKFPLKINVLNLRNKTFGAGCPKSNVTRQVI